MKERLEKQWLQTVSVKKEDVQWVKAGKEIWLGNRMFDIKSSQLKDGYYTFTGLYDDDETSLVKKLQNTQQEERKTGNKLLAQLFQLLQTPCDGLQQETLSGNSTAKTLYYIEKSDPLSQYSDIITPPPQL